MRHHFGADRAVYQQRFEPPAAGLPQPSPLVAGQPSHRRRHRRGGQCRQRLRDSGLVDERQPVFVDGDIFEARVNQRLAQLRLSRSAERRSIGLGSVRTEAFPERAIDGREARL